MLSYSMEPDVHKPMLTYPPRSTKYTNPRFSLSLSVEKYTAQVVSCSPNFTLNQPVYLRTWVVPKSTCSFCYISHQIVHNNIHWNSEGTFNYIYTEWSIWASPKQKIKINKKTVLLATSRQYQPTIDHVSISHLRLTQKYAMHCSLALLPEHTQRPEKD